jgi:hypothetical protein
MRHGLLTEPEAGRRRLQNRTAVPYEVCGQRFDDPAGVGHVPIVGQEETPSIITRQRGRPAMDLVCIENFDQGFVVGAKLARNGRRIEAGLRAIDVQHAVALQELRCADRREERLVGVDRFAIERAQRPCGAPDLRGLARTAEMHEPRQERGELAPRERQRTERVGDPLRHLPERTRHRHRNDRARRDRARVAERRAVSGGGRIDDGHAMAVALEADRRRDADDAGADDRDFAHRQVTTPARISGR